jgi:hypothetical protein
MFGEIDIIFNDSAARVGTPEYPTQINDYTIAIHQDDKQMFLAAINNFTGIEPRSENDRSATETMNGLVKFQLDKIK